MCFSAPVSFAASALVSDVGFLALRTVHRPRERLFASIPLLFGIQQAIEGALWLALPLAPNGALVHGLTQAYAFFVGVSWPILIPLSLILIEPRCSRMRAMRLMLGLGLVAAVYTLTVMGFYGFTVHVDNQCLVYGNPPGIWPGMIAVYLVATCGAFFIASDEHLRWIGIANVIGFGVALSFFQLNFPSVWCFFAALISSLIYLYVRQDEPTRTARRESRA